MKLKVHELPLLYIVSVNILRMEKWIVIVLIMIIVACVYVEFSVIPSRISIIGLDQKHVPTSLEVQTLRYQISKQWL